MQGCLLRLIQKNSLTFHFDEKGNNELAFCGEELQKLSGYTIQELVQLPTNWLSIVHPDDKATLLKARKKLLSSKCEMQQTYRIITKQNQTRIIRERACVEQVDAYHQVSCVLTDLTDDMTKLIQQHVMESEARYRSLFEHAPVGMLIMDTEGKKQVIASNPKWEEWMKSDSETIMKGNLLAFSPRQQPNGELSSKKLHALFNDYHASLKAKSFEWQFQDIEGVLRDMLVKLYPITVDGKQQTILFANDVSALKESERNLRKALEKAKESDTLKSAFITNFSHEIRTPMNIIMGFSQLLALPNLDDEERRNFVELIGKNVEDLLVIIEQIIEISRIETGQLAMAYEHVRVVELFQIAYHTNRTAAHDKDIDLKFDLKASNFNTWIYTDHEKLLYILNHLIANAVKFTDEGSVQFWYNASERNLEIVVKDTGCGIAEDKQEEIFKSFRQLENPSTKRYRGLGLGLPITKGYVEALHGTIELNSTVDVGTTFHVRLPLDPRIPQGFP